MEFLQPLAAPPITNGILRSHSSWLKRLTADYSLLAQAGFNMRFDDLSFGSIRIDGIAYEHDVVVERAKIRKRKKKPSRKFRGEFGHTPLSIAEKIPWRCRRLVVGTGNHGALPVMKDVKAEAQRRNVDLLVVPTAGAIQVIKERHKETNAILQVTC